MPSQGVRALGIPVLIDRPPEILLFPLDGDDRFIEMPGVAQLALSLFQSSRIGRAKFQAPPPDRFVGHDDAPFSQELFDFTKAEAKAMVEPHRVADLFGCHAEQSAKRELT